jgi:hypothetical protein
MYVYIIIIFLYHPPTVAFGTVYHFFTEIERRNISGFLHATNTTSKETALNMLTKSCTLYLYAGSYGASTSSSAALCPSEYFNLTTALIYYNNTNANNVTICEFNCCSLNPITQHLTFDTFFFV